MPQDVRTPPSIVTVPDAPTEPDAFLRWSAGRPRNEGRYELSRGVVIRYMVNVTRRHSEVCMNIAFALGGTLDRDRFLITVADFAVKTGYSVRSPDVLVEPRGGDGQSLSTTTPTLLVEVLSPSTAGIDFTEKREEYFAVASLQTYLICAADEPRVWAWRRNPDGSWPAKATMFESREDAVTIAGLDVDLPLAAIYRGIP